MEIKVLCVCGTKYKFDVEPVNQRMPWPVNCPACGADGTAQANEVIQQTVAAVPVATVPRPAAIPPAAFRIHRSPPAAAPPPVPSAAPAPLAAPPPEALSR